MDMPINGRFIKFFKVLDTTAIEIKETDYFYKDIEFLDYDKNYEKCCEFCVGKGVFSLYFPSGKEAVAASGEVIHINNKEFEHDIPTELGSAGFPIILLSNNKVIGIHCDVNWGKQTGIATFIFFIINEINKPIKTDNKSKVFDKNKKFYNKIINNIDNNINIFNNKILYLNNPKVNNEINYNNKMQPFNNNLNNIKGNYIQKLNNNGNNSNRAPGNNNPLLSSNISNNSIKSQNEKVLVLTND